MPWRYPQPGGERLRNEVLSETVGDCLRRVCYEFRSNKALSEYRKAFDAWLRGETAAEELPWMRPGFEPPSE